MKHPSAKRLRSVMIILFWLVLWQAAAWMIHNNILLVGPAEVLLALASLFWEGSFWLSLAASFTKISLGFLGAFFLGILVGAAAFVFPFLQDVLQPVIAFLKSVPVASFVILALIWAGSENLSVLIAFLVVFPILYVNTIAGLSSTDQKLLEMAQVFSITGWRKIRCLYWPALLPYLTSACRTALGMSWKSGVAAEVIGVPDNTIGEGLYMSKIYLDTPGLFAWTLVIILVSGLFEHLFLFLLSQTRKGGLLVWSSILPPSPESFSSPGLVIQNLNKSYGQLKVLKNLSLTLLPGKPQCIMAPSGYGKTTLFLVLLGLESADSGEVFFQETKKSPVPVAAVFQEDRLCQNFSPIDNIRLAVPSLSRAQAARELQRILPAECLNRPVSTLSGGMKRRTAIARALLTPSPILIMDEPVTGLDEETKDQVILYILEKSQKRLLILSTHEEEDAQKLGGQILHLEQN